jgi:hypothetical protein
MPSSTLIYGGLLFLEGIGWLVNGESKWAPQLPPPLLWYPLLGLKIRFTVNKFSTKKSK